jgi:hypothetical protein
LHTVTCDLPSQLLKRPVVVDAGSQDYPHMEGQSITYTCPHGLILTGPNASVCSGNRRWEPDPGQMDCIGDLMPILSDAIIVHTCIMSL